MYVEESENVLFVQTKIAKFWCICCSLFPVASLDWRPFNKNEEMMLSFVAVDIYTWFNYLVYKVWIQSGCWCKLVLFFASELSSTIWFTNIDVFFIFIIFICILLLSR